LLTLKLTDNKITSLKILQAAATKDPEDGEEALSNWPCLVLLNLQKNLIKELSPISTCPNLRYLDLSDNHISLITDDFDGHP